MPFSHFSRHLSARLDNYLLYFILFLQLSCIRVVFTLEESKLGQSTFASLDTEIDERRSVELRRLEEKIVEVLGGYLQLRMNQDYPIDLFLLLEFSTNFPNIWNFSGLLPI